MEKLTHQYIKIRDDLLSRPVAQSALNGTPTLPGRNCRITL